MEEDDESRRPEDGRGRGGRGREGAHRDVGGRRYGAHHDDGRRRRDDTRGRRDASRSGRPSRERDGGRAQGRDNNGRDRRERERGARGPAPRGERGGGDRRFEHRSRGGTPRSGAPRGGASWSRAERDPRGTSRPRDRAPRRPPDHADPPLPATIRASDLDFGARKQLKPLSKENAEFVARHLAMAGRLIDDDPGLAHEHALAASRKGARIAVVRETLAITAYVTGDYALALRELRTYRRISGSDDEIPLMVDSERGLGRPDRALEVGREADRGALPAEVQVHLAIAMSGARLDLGQPEMALAELEIPQLDRNRAFSYSPELFRAYAEVLDELGHADEARRWHDAADRAEAALEARTHDEFETIPVTTEFDATEPEAAAPDRDSGDSETRGRDTGRGEADDDQLDDAPVSRQPGS